jgi:hypothetical protein
MRMVAVALMILVLYAPAPAEAQFDWRAELRSEQVRLVDGNFTYTETGLLTIAVPRYEPVTLQYQINSRAPASGVISRDNFIGMTAQFSSLFMIMAFAEAYNVTASTFLEAVAIEQTTELIGNPDIRLNLYMTGEGMQIEWIGPDGQTTRFTQTWQQVYGR